ncbi:MAG TPA: TIGR03118 family protein [Aliidongia sp.]|nr:TIGR03118 family protein [Aliidongia sp.]
MKSKTPLLAAALTVALMSIPLLSSAQAQSTNPLAPFVYHQTNLASNTPGVAAFPDALLGSPRGFANQPGGSFVIAGNGTGEASLHNGDGSPAPLFSVAPGIILPSPSGGVPGGFGTLSGPTGVVWNPTPGFVVPGTNLPALFLFVTQQGAIDAWAPNLPGDPVLAVRAVDNSSVGANYTSLAFGASAQGTFIYAANVASGQIDVFDENFQAANGTLPGKFVDPEIPAGYVPFGIQSLDGTLAVTYAKQNAQKNFIVPGAGAGFVDIYDTDGQLLQRLASGGLLNAPWGVTRAPSAFGGASGQILVGNFGDGHILAFDQSGQDVQFLVDQQFQPIVIPGLWGLHFGGGADSGPRTLFFTAGPDSTHGLFGSLTSADPFEF